MSNSGIITNKGSLYTRKGEKVSLDGFDIVKQDEYKSSYTFEKGDTSIRVFTAFGIDRGSCIEEKTFNIAKEIDSNSLPKLGDMLFYNKKFHLFMPPVGYTMERIDDGYVSILTLNRDLLIDHVTERLGILAEKLAERRVTIGGENLTLYDVEPSNLTINRHGAIVTNPDILYRQSKIEKSLNECIIQNKKAMLELIRSTIIKDYSMRLAMLDEEKRLDANHMKKVKYRIEDLTNETITDHSDLSVIFAKKLINKSILEKIEE